MEEEKCDRAPEKKGTTQTSDLKRKTVEWFKENRDRPRETKTKLAVPFEKGHATINEPNNTLNVGGEEDQGQVEGKAARWGGRKGRLSSRQKKGGEGLGGEGSKKRVERGND